MRDGIDISLEGISKRYRIPSAEARGSGGILGRFRPLRQDFWAVRDVSFAVPRAQTLGVIGHNGAGKSTMLKLLSGITAPSTGELSVRGRLAALLEVGSGFHPELTGRENVFLSGSILGMRRREIHQKLDSIIDFAEVREFIDVPVKRYSSGMYVRLGFSIAAHLNPDVLLLDEVLAVGDASFQEKCREHILGMQREGTTILFISHDLKAVQTLCHRVIVMSHGRMIYDGETAAAIEHYRHASHTEAGGLRRVERLRGLQITAATAYGDDGHPTTTVRAGEPLRLRIAYCAEQATQGVRFRVHFYDADETVLAEIISGPEEWVDIPAGPASIDCVIDEIALQNGVYRVDVTVDRLGDADPMDWLVNCISLHVEGRRGCGVFHQAARWHAVSAAGV